MSGPALVAVRGDGIAAYCCTHLLRKAGVAVNLERMNRPRVPALLISQAALDLLRDIFDSPRLLESSPLIRRRVVAWQRGSAPAPMEHRGYVTSEAELLESLLPPDAGAALGGTPVWRVYSSPPLPEGVTQQRFGSRMASAWRVRLRRGALPDCCMMESLETGWLFLLPDSDGAAWLLAVGESAADPLVGSRVIAREVEALEHASAPFPTHPRMASALAANGWLACGSAAMAFDPICGDGTAMAVREAILAAAVIRAALGGGDEPSLRAHYEGRLRAGFARHLELCRQFYGSGFGGAWWDREFAGLDSSRVAAPHAGMFRYRLEDFDLVPIRPESL